MSLPVFYFEPGGVDTASGRLSLRGDDARHLARSMRARVGDHLLVGDGLGTLYHATIGAVLKSEVTALVDGSAKVEREVPAITLYQAVSRPSSMDETVYRAAEAGIETVVPFISERSAEGAEKAAAERFSRWVKISREASKVARRAWQLRVSEPLPGPPARQVLGGHGLSVVLWEDEREVALGSVLPARPPESIAIVAGPEGGFSSDEALSVVAAGGITTGIGHLVLRAETAGAYAAMVVRYQYGLLGPRGCFADARGE